MALFCFKHKRLEIDEMVDSVLQSTSRSMHLPLLKKRRKERALAIYKGEPENTKADPESSEQILVV
jgi:hypothetical protein